MAKFLTEVCETTVEYRPDADLFATCYYHEDGFALETDARTAEDGSRLYVVGGDLCWFTDSRVAYFMRLVRKMSVDIKNECAADGDSYTFSQCAAMAVKMIRDERGEA